MGPWEILNSDGFMNWLPAAIGGVNDFFNMLGTFGANVQNTITQDRGTAMLGNLYDRQMGGANALAGQIPAMHGQLAGDMQNAWINNVQNPVNQAWADLRSNNLINWQGARDQAMGMIQGAGSQERLDINTQFDNYQSQLANDLTSRGLQSTSAGVGPGGLIERQRTDALGGLNERLLQQFLGQFGAYTQPMLQTDLALGQGTANTMQNLYSFGFQNDQSNFFNQLNAFGAFGQLPLQYDRDLTGMQLNWMGQNVAMPPQQGPFASFAAGIPRPQPSTPEAPFDWGAITNPLGTFGGLLSAAAILK